MINFRRLNREETHLPLSYENIGFQFAITISGYCIFIL